MNRSSVENIDDSERKKNRLLSIDVLKGLTILVMAFVNSVALFDNTPAWSNTARAGLSGCVNRWPRSTARPLHTEATETRTASELSPSQERLHSCLTFSRIGQVRRLCIKELRRLRP